MAILAGDIFCIKIFCFIFIYSGSSRKMAVGSTKTYGNRYSKTNGNGYSKMN